MTLRVYDYQQQVSLVADSIHDDRPTLPTGVVGIDSLLRRGGFLPGTFALLGGRTGTRKSTVAANMMVSMAQANTAVGLVGLDEQPWQYVVSLLSVLSGRSRDWVEFRWDREEGIELRQQWEELAKGRVYLFGGQRPSIEELDAAVDMAAVGEGQAPQVLFVDYMAKMAMPETGSELERVLRLAEEFSVWSTRTGISVVALHHVGRNDQYGNTNNRNAGHLPVSLEQLKYGGEDPADIVFGVYRPAMDPIGNMEYSIAKLVLGKAFDEDAYFEAKARVRKYKDSTFLQLLKNRPGTQRDEKGVELVSPSSSLRLMEREGEDHADDADVRTEAPTRVRRRAD